MARRGRGLLLWLGLCLAAYAAGAQEAPRVLPQSLQIGLAAAQKELALSLPAGAAAAGAQGQVWQTEVDAGLVCTVGGDGGLQAGDLKLGPGPLRFTAPAGLLGFGQRLYRGAFLILVKDGKLNLINEVGLDDYLRGVLPVEVSPAWPLPALKAQAIVARTFAVMNRGKHRKEGFELCAEEGCQVYRGASVENAFTDQAVAETQGLVVTYQGRLASTFYYSASGGHTEDIQNVWPSANPPPYLRGVPDPTEISPYGQWIASYDWPVLEAIVLAKLPELGALVAVSVKSRSASGRAIQVEIYGERAIARISGADLRAMLNLRSTLIELRTEYGVVPAPGTGAEAEAAAPAAAPQGPFDLLALWPGLGDSTWRITPVRLVINGRGNGHGVGLSQWGAKSLAENGYTETMILKYYYPGAEVEDWRPPAAPPETGNNGVVTGDAG